MMLVAGLGVLVAGSWGTLAPYVGTILHRSRHGHGAKAAWTADHFYLHLLPGAAAVAGAVLILLAARRSPAGRNLALVGAVLALAAGAWFVVGSSAWSAIHPPPRRTAAASPAPKIRSGPRVSPLRRLGTNVGDHFGPALLLLTFGGVAFGGAVVSAPTLSVPPPQSMRARVA
jgi:hypothetical protein